MNPLLWMLAGIGVSAVFGLAFFLVAEREFREAFGQVLAALFVAPTILLGVVIRCGLPRAMPLSPEALALFARQRESSQQSAWLIGYRGSGVIVVRRRTGRGWLNDVPNRAHRARNDVRERERRPAARVIQADDTNGPAS